jgi:hypothetical protein
LRLGRSFGSYHDNTLSEWAVILFGLLLAGGAAVMILRRRQFG